LVTSNASSNDNGGKPQSAVIDRNYKHLSMHRYGENGEKFYVATTWLNTIDGTLTEAGKLHCALPHPNCPKPLPLQFRPTAAEIKAKKRAHLSVVSSNQMPS